MSEMASVLLCLPERVAMWDPEPTVTGQRDVRLVDRWDETVIGVVGWSEGGVAALRIAADHPDLGRLAIVSTPFREQDLEQIDVGSITAKTLLVFGADDPMTGSHHGRSWKKSLPGARLEMVPGGSHDLLVPMWPRVLSHLAPGRTR